MLGSFTDSPGSNGIEPLRGRLRSRPTAKETKKQEQNFAQLIEREWSELPYAMMRISAARRPWDGKRVYWRDRIVQLGDVDLHLKKSRAADSASPYTAAYTQAELRCDFTLHPSLEEEQLRWSAPGITEVQLTTEQLAEKLLGKLVTFYASGLAKPAATFPASPSPSS